MPIGFGGIVHAARTALVTLALLGTAQAATEVDRNRDPRNIRIVNNSTAPIQVLIDPFGHGTIAAGATGGLSSLTDLYSWMRLERKINEATKAGHPVPMVKVTVRAILSRHLACRERVDYFTSYGMTITVNQAGGRDGPITCVIKPGPPLRYRLE